MKVAKPDHRDDKQLWCDACRTVTKHTYVDQIRIPNDRDSTSLHYVCVPCGRYRRYGLEGPSPEDPR